MIKTILEKQKFSAKELREFLEAEYEKKTKLGRLGKKDRLLP